MTPNQMRKKADEIEAAGGPNATERANALRDRANDMEEEGYQKSGGGYGMKAGGMTKYAKGGMPDLTGDGKVTRADVLKGRGVFKKGGMISEYGGKEKYKSKAAMKKHESKESKTEEKMEKGMHRMPDGKMMKNSAHKKPKKMMGGGSVKGYGMARGGRACKMV